MCPREHSTDEVNEQENERERIREGEMRLCCFDIDCQEGGGWEGSDGRSGTGDAAVLAIVRMHDVTRRGGGAGQGW